ncbi:MAG TPA: ABC transporter ATP-binding protein [Tepidisphaeraceae bacterium]|nr:ABC transporter ATP-binding protein [Tepidisphaeraceae bacterium]
MSVKVPTSQLTRSDHPVVIDMRNVTKIFGTRTVLDDISLQVHKGESLVIMGGTGCGKSTTLRIMSGILKPDKGDVICFGKSLNEMTDEELIEYRKRGIGVLFQSGALFNSMNVHDNVALPLREHTDLEESTIDVVVKIKLELVGLRHHADKMPAQLSGGMKKRAGLARAMALDPKILFYDEPSAGLDPVTSAEIDDLIIGLNKRLGVSTVVVTHEMDSAFRVADRMVLLDRGKFVASGKPEEMKNSTDPLVHQFIFGLTEGPLTQRRREGNYEEDLLSTKSE